jgi:hypothetical protein
MYHVGSTSARRRSPRPRNDITHKPKPSHADRSGVSKANRSRGQEAETETRERRQTPSEEIALKGWRVSNPLVPRGLRVKPGGWLGDESGFHSSCSFDGAMRSGGGIRVTGSRMPETRSSDLGRRSILQSSSDRPRSRIQTRSYCNQNESLGAR